MTVWTHTASTPLSSLLLTWQFWASSSATMSQPTGKRWRTWQNQGAAGASCSPTPLIIDGYAVERGSSFRYLGVHISKDPTWTEHTQAQTRKTRLYHLRQLRKFRVSPGDPKDFLLWCCGKCPDTEHHLLFLELQCPGP